MAKTQWVFQLASAGLPMAVNRTDWKVDVHRLQTWTRPNNPGLTAAEALTSNFFTKRTSCRMVVEKQRTFEKRS